MGEDFKSPITSSEQQSTSSGSQSTEEPITTTSPEPSTNPSTQPTPQPTTQPTTQPTPSTTPQPTPSPTATPAPTKAPSYTVNFMMDDGKVLQSQVIESGKSPQRPINPSKDNYDFVGWYTVDSNGNLQNEFQFQTKISGDLLIYAKFSPKKYNITYIVPDGAYNNNPSQYEYGKGIQSLNDPSLDSNIFKGWYTEQEFKNQVTSIGQSQSGDITLYAKFEKVYYGITYILNGGTNSEENPTQYYQGEYYKLKDPYRDGYTFGGWYEDSEFKYKRTQIDPDNNKNFTLYAQWIPVTYNIEYETAGGSMQEQAIDTYNQQDGLYNLPVPQRKGYRFLGWFTDEQLTNQVSQISQGTKGDIKLYASWEAKEVYITYNLNGGTNSENNPNVYVNGEDSIKLEQPTKDEYEFAGWFSDIDFKNQVYTIDGVYDEINLYAKWTYIGDSSQTDQSLGNSNNQNSSQKLDENSANTKTIYTVAFVLIVIAVVICAVIVVPGLLGRRNKEYLYTDSDNEDDTYEEIDNSVEDRTQFIDDDKELHKNDWETQLEYEDTDSDIDTK